MIFSRKPASKKPAGAVSLFGGVDIFGKSDQSEKGAEPVHTTEAPPTQPKVAAKPKKPSLSGGGGGGLFDGGEEEGDDDIFSFLPATKKNRYVDATF